MKTIFKTNMAQTKTLNWMDILFWEKLGSKTYVKKEKIIFDIQFLFNLFLNLFSKN